MRTHERTPHLAQHSAAATIPFSALSRPSRGPSFGAPGDRSEQEAERAAAQVTRTSDGGAGIGEPGRESLSPGERAFYEPLFSHNFSQVRIHDDARSARIADAMGTEAFTYGRDIFFGSGMRKPRGGAGGRLMAHELAHVVQQSRSEPTLQPKLKITGPADFQARAAALLNGGLGSFYYVAIDKSGDFKMEPVRAAHTSSIRGPDPQVKALAERLWTVVSDAKEVNMTVSAGTATSGGSYATGDFDIADLEVYGVPGLIHEIVEQHLKQTKGMEYGGETSGAHGEATVAESEVRGAKRGKNNIISQTNNADGTRDAVIETPYTYPDGTVKTMVRVIKKNNFISMTWK